MTTEERIREEARRLFYQRRPVTYREADGVMRTALETARKNAWPYDLDAKALARLERRLLEEIRN